MKDFTKEELDYISDILKIHINDYPTLTSRDSDFLSKIQSMIDNYCEHEIAVWPLYTSTGDMPCAGLCFTCNKCVNREFIR